MNAPAPTTAAELLWSRVGPTAAVLCLVLLAIGGYLMDQAQPQIANLFDKRWDSTMRETWDVAMAHRALALLVGSLICSVVGLITKFLTVRSRWDASSRALVFFGALALLGLIFYALRGPEA